MALPRTLSVHARAADAEADVETEGSGATSSPRAELRRRRRGLATWSWWAVALVGAAALVAISVIMGVDGSFRPFLFPQHYVHGLPDLSDRITQMHQLRAGRSVYATFGGVGAFTYPPGAIFLFWPFSFLSSSVAIDSLWSLCTVAALAGSLVIAAKMVLNRVTACSVALAIWATVATCIVFTPMIETLVWGQTGTILLLLVMLDVGVLHRSAKGALIGVAGALKLYPGLFSLFYLFSGRRRAFVISLISAAVVLGAALVFWRQSTESFFTSILFGGKEFSYFSTPTMTMRSASCGAFLRRITALSGPLLVVLTVALTAAVVVGGLFAAVRLQRTGLPLTATVVVLFVSSVVSPSAWDHYFDFAPLLVLVAAEVGWRSALARISIAVLAVLTFPWYFYRFSTPSPKASAFAAFAHDALVLCARDAIFVASIAFLVAALLRSRRRRSGPRHRVGSSLATGPVHRRPTPRVGAAWEA